MLYKRKHTMYFNYPVYFDFLRKAKIKCNKTSMDLVQDVISDYNVDDIQINYEFDFNGNELYQYMCFKIGDKLNKEVRFPDSESILQKELFKNKTECFHELVTLLVFRYINLTKRNSRFFMIVDVFNTSTDYDEAKTVIKDVIEKFFMKNV